jgi:hypothetical protein
MLGRGAKDKEHAMTQTFNAAVSVVGIDIGKNSFHIVGHDERGANRRLGNAFQAELIFIEAEFNGTGVRSPYIEHQVSASDAASR